MRTVRNICGAGLAALVAASGAAAALEASAVWQNLQDAGALSGFTVTGTATPVEDGLRIEGLEYRRAAQGGDISMSIGQMRLIERADGAVDVVLPDRMPLRLAGDGADGPAFDARLTVAAPDLATVARQQGEGIAYDYTAPEMSVMLDTLVIDGAPAEGGGQLTLTDVIGQETLTAGAALGYAIDLTTGKVTLQADVTPAGAEGQVRVDATIGALSTRSRTTLPEGGPVQPLGAALKAGLSGEGMLRLTGLAFDVEIADKTGMVRTLSGAIEAATQESLLSAETTRYGYEQTGMSLDIAGGDVPGGKVGVTLARLASGITMPLAVTDEARDLNLSLRIGGLAADETLWSTFDPGAALPRDPADLTLELSGRGRWTADVLAPGAMADLEAPPGTLESLTIEALRLAALGAEVTASGSFGFDPADFESLGRPPLPEGSIEIVGQGINGLLDRLVDAGFIVPDQANGMRMMLGLFARPGEGEDRLVSEIEITPEGRVLANGMPVQ